MRNKRWLRYGLASIVVCGGAFGGLLVACGDDDSSSGNVQPDSGGDTNTGTETSTGTDSGPDVNKPDTGTPAKLVVVNAATGVSTDPAGNAGAIRFCFATATKDNPVDADFAPTPLGAAPEEKSSPAQPWPGIFIGTGGPFAGSGTPLEPITIRPYIFNAYRLAQGGVVGTDPAVPRCSKLLAAGATYPDGGQTLVENVDYWRLPDIPKGTLKQDKTYMLALIGCTQDAPAAAPNTPTSCGGGFTPDGGTGPGNLKVLVLELDTATTVAADEIGIQNVHLSASMQAATQAPVTPAPAFRPTLVNAEANGDASADAAAKLPASPNAADIAYSRDVTAPTPVVKVKGLITDTGYYAYAPATLLSENPVIPLALNNKSGRFPTVQQATTGNADAAANPIYANGQVYTFVLVGDPSASGAKLVHYLAFPNKQ